MALDLKQMEQDILETVHSLGRIGPLMSPSSRALWEKYSSTDAGAYLNTVIDYLVEKRYLFPFFDEAHKEVHATSAGLTPKGLRRLRELQHPWRTWVKKNWFPVAVAAITAFIGLLSVGVDLYLNWS